VKIDGVFHARLEKAPGEAKLAEAAGLGALWSLDTGHNPFLPLLLAAEHTTQLEVGTGIAVALARSPMTLAQEAWDLQRYSKGRFILGLGSQVEPHIVRRFSMPWTKPVEQMRDMIGALHAIWQAFQTDGKLKYDSEHYKLSLLTPFFNPGPISYSRPPIALAGVGPHMTELAGEVADGFYLHPFSNRAYFDSVTLPAIERGLATSGRSRKDFTLIAPVFIITGSDEQQAALEIKVREQIGFYGSTPAYAGVLDAIGCGELHRELHRLSKEGGWAQMGRLITDDILDAFAVRAPLPELPARLWQRFGGVYDRVVSQFPVPVEQVEVMRGFTQAINQLSAGAASGADVETNAG
jgi:probable F420-dependent oxidoreductase